MDDLAEKIQSILSDEESMKQIKELAEMFGAGQSDNNDAGSASPPKDSFSQMLDPAALMQLMQVLSKHDESCELISSLKPFLSPEKQERADRAIKLLKLYNVYIALRDSGMLGDFKL